MTSLEEYIESYSLPLWFKLKLLRKVLKGDVGKGATLYVNSEFVRTANNYSPEEIKEVYNMYRLLEL